MAINSHVSEEINNVSDLTRYQSLQSKVRDLYMNLLLILFTLSGRGVTRFSLFLFSLKKCERNEETSEIKQEKSEIKLMMKHV